MPSVASIFSLIERKLTESGISRNSYTISEEYRDDRYCLYQDESGWYVGWNERGQKRELARFVGDIEAAEYLIFLLRKDAADSNFPDIDWTEYATLP